MSNKVPLDIYDDMPKPMKRYLSHFGWHFNKAACIYAISKMWKEDANGKRYKIEVRSKEQIDDFLKKYGVELKNKNLYDYVYYFHTVLADLHGVSIDDDRHIALQVKAVIDDADNPGGNVFVHWYWDIVHKGLGVEFDDFLDD